MVLHLWGVLPGDLLQNFLHNASGHLRRHVMWFLGRDLGSADMPPEVRARALAYWEMRLAAAASTPNKDDYREELGAISNWVVVAKVDAEWLIAQQIEMFRAGFAPGHAFSVIEWTSKVAGENPDGAVELLEALFRNPHTEQWAYISQQGAVRTILDHRIGERQSRNARAGAYNRELARVDGRNRFPRSGTITRARKCSTPVEDRHAVGTLEGKWAAFATELSEHARLTRYAGASVPPLRNRCAPAARLSGPLATQAATNIDLAKAGAQASELMRGSAGAPAAVKAEQCPLARTDTP